MGTGNEQVYISVESYTLKAGLQLSDKGFSKKSTKPKVKSMTNADKSWLVKHTKFSMGELDKLYKSFRKEYPLGGIYRKQFAQFFPPGMASIHFCDHVFRTLDSDGNGYLDFKEFIMANDLIAARTVEEKLKWAFRVYDNDNSGAIDNKEMTSVLKMINTMVDGNVAGAIRGNPEEKAKKYADKLFQAIDIDNDGVLTEQEFIRGCMQDEDLMKSLNQIVQDCAPPVSYQSSYY